MDSFLKDSNNETAESFTQRGPSKQNYTPNLPYISNIQELTAILVTKKSQLRQAKLKQGNLL